MPEFAENYLGYLLARCSYEISARFHQKLKEEGVSVLTWRVLTCVRYNASTVNEIAAKALVNQSTLSKALDRMERDLLIVRERDPNFRSKTNVEITANGITLVDHLIDLANEYEEHSIQHMSEQDISSLHSLLIKLIDGK